MTTLRETHSDPSTPPPSRPRLFRPAFAILAVVAIAAGVIYFADDSGQDVTSAASAPIAALNDVDQIELVEIPTRSVDGPYEVVASYRVEGLPVINLTRTPDDLPPVDDGEWRCTVGDNSETGAACVIVGSSLPAVALINPDTSVTPDEDGETGMARPPSPIGVRWVDVPEEAAAVQFLQPDGTYVWQTPRQGIVAFPASFDEYPNPVNCDCVLEALNSSGDIIATVDIPTASYRN